MRSNLAKLVLLIVIGSVLLLAGLFLIWYPSYMIGSLQDSLSLSGLTQAEIYALAGSLNWWRTWGKITYETPSFLLFSAGILFLMFAMVYYSVAIRSENSRKNGLAS